MKIVFMGTPDFAIPSLKILIEYNHQILAVVTTAKMLWLFSIKIFKEGIAKSGVPIKTIFITHLLRSYKIW